MVPIPSFARKDFQSFLLVPSLRSGRRQTVFHLSNLRFSNEETDFVVWSFWKRFNGKEGRQIGLIEGVERREELVGEN